MNFRRACTLEELISLRAASPLRDAWGMHRMGGPEKTKTKLTDWQCFNGSIVSQGAALQQFRRHRMIAMSEREYSDALMALKPCYVAFNLSVSAPPLLSTRRRCFIGDVPLAVEI